ncbi:MULTISPECIES: fumarylacetoacetate hydrolase family protein [unclassified Psychrobacter]|uniref:fumarylacetoacetate hydrolase family protein n=1 Tax=unclassified Psychrobacter TaxID=196806 RepID=UPI0009E6B3D4|nr:MULTISPECIES: fumarylacetoacetate hydrolase family protein [unclassified Psychrobacter]
MTESPHVSLINDIVREDNEFSLDDDTSANNKRNLIGKVVCVGRNYAAHATELGNAVPTRPLLFIKPASSIISLSDAIPSSIRDVPREKVYPVHYEAEFCIRLGQDLKSASLEEVVSTTGLIEAVTLGLDLTLRDLQSELKEQGHPWERAKCFDGACVLADWVDPLAFGDCSDVHYQLYINDELKQDGNSALMLFPVYELLAEISHAFSLQAGDVIMTGTPSGVGILHASDDLKLVLGAHEWQARVQ